MRRKYFSLVSFTVCVWALGVLPPAWAQQAGSQKVGGCAAECQAQFAQDFVPYHACLEADVARRRTKVEYECITYTAGSAARQECFRQVFQEGTDCRLGFDLGACIQDCVAVLRVPKLPSRAH